MTVIEVTQDDIDRGVRGKADRCPIAIAMNRTLGDGWNVYGDFALWADGRPGFTIGMPREAEDFVNDFDERKPVKPFDFTIVI